MIMTRLFYIACFLFLITCDLFSQTIITSIEISGNEYLTKGDILNLMVSKKDGTFREEQYKTDLKTIRDKYKSLRILVCKIQR